MNVENNEEKVLLTDFQKLTNEIAQFSGERDWEQFHTPRNLILALTGEVGELAAEFQWTSDGEVIAMLENHSKM
jgi:dCTP diphosphatase